MLNNDNDNDNENEENYYEEASNKNPTSSFLEEKKQELKHDIKQKVKKKILSNPIVIKIIIGTIIICVILFLLLIIIVAILGVFSSSNSLIGGYYANQCQEMTVNFYSSDGAGGWVYQETKTYDFEDYIAGVVLAEFGAAENDELYKSLAIAARTYALYTSDSCTIDSSSQTQNFSPSIIDDTSPRIERIKQAVKDTAGVVVTRDGGLVLTEYDAFCFVDKNSRYYKLSDIQGGQRIPTSWAESHVWSKQYLNCQCEDIIGKSSNSECYTNGIYIDGGHGRGMSQYGALYLAEQGFSYEQILAYYYGDDIILSTNTFTSFEGIDIKNTTKATEIRTNLSSFLKSHGSSIEQLNAYIKNNVESVGPGTRAGVVMAATSLINYLYDNYNAKLPYYWGGKYAYLGVDPNFGSYVPSSASRNGNIYYYKSFDCSGFVNWAIRNGGFNFSEKSSANIDAAFSSNDKCNITDSSCIGLPGDLINSPADHVVLILAIDEESNNYIIAESGGYGVAVSSRPMHKNFSSNKTTSIIHMENYYSNQNNVNKNY